MDEIAIKVDGVSKNFKLPHEQAGSLKNVFTNAFRHVRKKRTFDMQHALSDISFEVKKGEFFGIVGRNGSGKSTLLKMLAGIYQPNKGSIMVNGRLVPFIELGVGFNAELTGRENVYLNGALIGFDKDEIDAMYQEIVDFAELEKFMDQKLKNYSSGMQVRLAFSLAIRADADILLVDEVLAVGDAAFQRKCFQYFKELKANKKTVIFVTHDMNSVREYCDRAMLINNSKMKLLGSPEDISREYALLFIDNGQASGHDKKGNTNRWGNGDVKMQDIVISVNDEHVTVRVNVQVNKPVDKLIYGLHILGEDGVEITAMNNRMIHVPDVQKLKPGSRVDFVWEMLNIFNDGTYFITLTFIDDVATTLDWFVGAGSFRVERVERSTTAILPPVRVTSNMRLKGGKNGS
jgi:ABC-2 type transport system ATP-binding protein